MRSGRAREWRIAVGFLLENVDYYGYKRDRPGKLIMTSERQPGMDDEREATLLN